MKIKYEVVEFSHSISGERYCYKASTQLKPFWMGRISVTGLGKEGARIKLLNLYKEYSK